MISLSTSKNSGYLMAAALALLALAIYLRGGFEKSHQQGIHTDHGDISSYITSLELQHHRLLRAAALFTNRSGLVSKSSLHTQLDHYKKSLRHLDYHLTAVQRSMHQNAHISNPAVADASNIHQQMINSIETLRHNGEPTLLYTQVLVDWIEPGDLQNLTEIRITLYALGDDIASVKLAAIDYSAYLDDMNAARKLILERRLHTSYWLMGIAVFFLVALILLYVQNQKRSATSLKIANESLQTEIEASSRLTEKLEFHATHDALSQVLNRRGFCNELDKVLKNTTTDHGLCFIDLDLFKIVNDTAGHAAGDELIRQIAHILTTTVSYCGAEVARFGGDEFLILLPDCTEDEFRSCITRASSALSPYHFSFEDKTFSITGSFGAIHFRSEDHCQHSLLSVADTACYVAKQSGGGRTHFYNDDNSVTQLRKNVDWITKINHALQNDRFCLYFQPIVKTSAVAECNAGTAQQPTHSWEVLVRMLDTDNRLIQPGEFLEVAERYSLAPAIDRWVVTKSLEWLEANAFVLQNDIEIVNINLSGKTIGDTNFLDFIEQSIDNLTVPTSAICFEITETAAVGESSIEFLQRLHELGFKLALDDFGSGFSSFGYLEKLPVDYIKIDGRFVRDIDHNATHKEFVRAIHAVGKVMNKLTVAEFLENAESLSVLQELGVNYVQGYHIAKPAPLPDSRLAGQGFLDAA
ncbi:hypothetical protein AB833_12665 [Chromatiales bacterium (ex Bugula neritina AB1)]|nr:hypothetical protein AB833_12665 [Chromatiales bacterium (ex Bugula neritina AB1)]